MYSTCKPGSPLGWRPSGRLLCPRRCHLPPSCCCQRWKAPIVNSIESIITEKVDDVVRSDTFSSAWATVNRAAHQQLVVVLTADELGALEVEGGTVSLNLAAFIATVKQNLLDRGYAFAERIPEVSGQFVLLQSAELDNARRYAQLLDRLATVLPWIVLALLAGGIAMANNRRRALVGTALGLALAMLVLLVRPPLGRELVRRRDSRRLAERGGRQVPVGAGDLVPHAGRAGRARSGPRGADRRADRRAVAVGGVLPGVDWHRPPAAGSGVRRGAPRGHRDGQLGGSAHRVVARADCCRGGRHAVGLVSYPTGLVVLGVAIVAGLVWLLVEAVAATSESHHQSAGIGQAEATSTLAP